MTNRTQFKQRLKAGEALIGTWIKTPSSIVTEILCGTELDVVCLDAEHAPFDRRDLDACILAARAAAMPCLVRVPSAHPHHILNALDLGATGVVIPHVASRQDALDAVKHAHFGRGGRGYAGSTRAAGYTRRAMADNLRLGREATVVVAQIEDVEGLEAIDDISAVEGIDCLFIGRADLAVSLGATSINAPEVDEASLRIVAAARKHQRPVGMFLGDVAEAAPWKDRGVSLFLLESDHVFLMKGAVSLMGRFKAGANGDAKKVAWQGLV